MPRLMLRLPEVWTVMDEAVAEGVAVAVAEHERAQRTSTVSEPLLYATMLAALTDGDELEDVLLAGLVITSVSADRLDEALAPDEVRPRMLRGIEITPGLPADFMVVTIPAVHGDVAALLTFGTPNLPRWDEMYAGFQAIAGTVRWQDPA